MQRVLTLGVYSAMDCIRMKEKRGPDRDRDRRCRRLNHTLALSLPSYTDILLRIDMTAPRKLETVPEPIRVATAMSRYAYRAPYITRMTNNFGQGVPEVILCS